jgi:hypothetical protein
MTPSPLDSPANLIADLEHAIRPAMEAAGVPGLALAVIRDGALFCRCDLGIRRASRLRLDRQLPAVLPVTASAVRCARLRGFYDDFLDRLLSTYCTDGLIGLSVR